MFAASESSSLHAYVVTALLTGARTEELRALTWDHLDLVGELPSIQHARANFNEQPDPRRLVFCTASGKPLDAANVRHAFRGVVAAAGLDAMAWTPRELRHSFVSLLSSSGMPIEDISQLVGHASTRVTEKVYRKELRPVLTRGAKPIDAILG